VTIVNGSIYVGRGPKKIKVADLPDPTTLPLWRAYASDEIGGTQFVFSDGLAWRRERDLRKAIAAPKSFIINGQSNACAAPPIPWGASALTRLLGSDLLGWSDATGAFTAVVDGPANAKVITEIGADGPGLGQIGTRLARHLADLYGDVIRTFALGYTGQGIDYFLPSSATKAYYTDSSQHATLNNYNLLKAYVDASGIVPELYVWCQGEADAGADQATYYAKLKTLYDQTRIDYPGIRWIIIGTIGNAQQRLVEGTLTVAGVFAAQEQLAKENPDSVILVDNRDFSKSTALYGGALTNGDHYTSYAGYKKAEQRLFAALQGYDPGSAVEPIAHLDDVFAWTQRYQYRRSLQDGNVVAWQGDIDVSSAVPGGNAPLHVAYSNAFGENSAIRFDGANSECLKKTGLAATDDWTIFAVAKTDALGSTQELFMVTDADNNNRAGFDVVGQSNAFKYMYGGNQVAFNQIDATPDAACAHTYMWTLDTTNGVLKLYVDGVLNGVNSAPIGSEIGMTDLWIGSFINAVFWFTGEIAAMAYKLGGIADADAAKAAHDWARVEFELRV
jgi:hypothetical protein